MTWEAQKRWLAKPGNREKHRASVAACRKRPTAKETHRQRQLKYAAQHREQERVRAAKWRAENPVKVSASKRSYYVKNADKVKTRNKKFREGNPALYREYQNDYKARKRTGTIVRLPKDYRDALLLKQAGRCMACDALLLVTGFHVDHIIAVANKGEHVFGNLQLLCPTCNRRKSAKDFSVFLAQLEREKCLM